MDNPFLPEKKDIVSYRKVITDAQVWPWESMPEVQPPTLRGLVEYLKTCPGWDFRRLSTKHAGWESRVVSYGMRSQFYLSVVPSREDLKWLEELRNKDTERLAKCFCGRMPYFKDDNCMMIGADEFCTISCECGLSLGHVCHSYKVKSDIYRDWNEIMDKVGR